jgi:hypothetical protein
MLRRRGIVIPYHRAITEKGLSMKKNRDSSELAARITAAASQPAGKKFRARASTRTRARAKARTDTGVFDARDQSASRGAGGCARARAPEVQEDQSH